MTIENRIEAAFKEEHEAALDFAKITREETGIQIRKTAARKRLTNAQEEKRSIINELMAR